MEPDVIAWPDSRHAGPPLGSVPRTSRTSSSGEVLTGLFSQHYVPLVRLTAMLLRDLTAAEEVVQDAFVAMHGRRMRDPDEALAYLRRAVVNGSRSVLRDPTMADRNPPQPVPDISSAEHGVVRMEMSAVAAALGSLPRRQREAVVLRYYADLAETEAAAALGISEGAVRSDAHRGMGALRQQLDEWYGG
jgi:RNA polymerase sigma-70 factor (sigma-E family)